MPPKSRRRTGSLVKKKEPKLKDKSDVLRAKLDMYIDDFDRQLQHEIDDMQRETEELQNTVRNRLQLSLMRLNKEAKQMTKLETYAAFEKWEEAQSVTESFRDVAACSSSAKPNDFKIPSNSKTLGKKSLEKRTKKRVTSGTFKRPLSRTLKRRSATVSRTSRSRLPKRGPVHTPTCSYPTPGVGFTPKFDPRLPFTPESGLRGIKPGERFVLMSMSGSPLMNESGSSPSTVVSLQDGKAVSVTARMQMSNLDDLDEDTRAKINAAQHKLNSLLKLTAQ